MKAMTRYESHRRPGPANGWGRFRRLVAIAAVVAAAASAVALLWLAARGPLNVHLAVATVLGVGGSVLLAGVLMALAFHSARSGMDEGGGTIDEGDHGQ